MTQSSRTQAAAEFDRPLLLTARQDLLGYLLAALGRAVLLALTATSVLAVLLIFVFIIRESLPFFTKGFAPWTMQAFSNVAGRTGELLTHNEWLPTAEPAVFGASAIVFGSALVTGAALLFAVPVSLLTAVCLSDIVPFRVRQVIKPVIEVLAAIPSVAYGFFAIKVVAPWLQLKLGLPTGANALNASMVLAIMALPTIVSVAEDSLTAMGRELREASYALGATRAETLIKVVMPAAHNGLIAAVILGMMRAVGETMVVWMASGNAGQIPAPWWNLTESVRTLTATIAGDMAESPVGSDHRYSLFSLGLLLLAFTFVLNLMTERFLRRIRQGSRSTPRPAAKRRRIGHLAAPVRKVFRLLALAVRPATDAVRVAAGRVTTKGRFVWDRGFTGLAWLSIAAVAVALAVILAPILYKGSQAVVFRGTIEFRKMQLGEFGRGDAEAIAREEAQVAPLRRQAYDIVDHFKRGIDTSGLTDQARTVYREYRKQLDGRGVDRETRSELSEFAKGLRVALEDAYGTTDKAEALERLDFVLSQADDPRLADSVAAQFFDMARGYRQIVQTVDLTQRGQYLAELNEVQDILQELFGPRPGESLPALAQDRYGSTRWDMAQQQFHRLFWVERWVSQGAGQLNKRLLIPREEAFEGTHLAALFPLMRDKGEQMLNPRVTFYGRYFTDTAPPGHYFGGVGPEVVGTLLITLCTIMVALPLGVIAAAYLVESAGDNTAVRVIRTCINSLAGVPSIVFGLFGLAFFVMWFLPKLGLESNSSIIAGSLTLALLILPVIIRASEEAIRSVPQSYREGALAAGASKFRCFVTVTLPAALPGILTGAILGISRAAGETAPLLFTAAVAFRQGFPQSLSEPTQTLSYSSYDMAVGDRIAAMVPHNQYGMVATLVVLVLILNGAAIVLRSRISKRLRGQ